MEGLEMKRKLKAEKDRGICEEYNLKPEDYSRNLVKRKSIFDLRTESMRTDGGNPRKGRVYSTVRASENGGVRVEEMIYGLKLAHLSCTDDTEDRLKSASPNSIAALIKAVGGENPEETIKLPLSKILKERFDLNLDCWMDESGFRKTRAVDTQGYIASNDDTIVLAYRYTTSIYDWMANLSMTSSEWEIDKDEALGHAGVFSSCRGWWTKLCNPRKKSKPRVHTAYYNNLIYTIPMIRKHIINPLVKDIKAGAKPKKIYVSGCSLGAAISQLAFCFILDELFPYLSDPEYKGVERLISVTAGSPRVADKTMRRHVMEQMETLRKLDRAVICRLVHNNDIVPHAPPNILNYRHLDTLVYMTKDGKNVLINPDLSKIFTKFSEVRTIYRTLFNKKKQDFNDDFKEKRKLIAAKQEAITEDLMQNLPSTGFSKKDEVDEKETEEKKDLSKKDDLKKNEIESEVAPCVDNVGKTAFEIECENSAEVILDHMPFWYMTYLENLKEEEDALAEPDEKKMITGSAEA